MEHYLKLCNLTWTAGGIITTKEKQEIKAKPNRGQKGLAPIPGTHGKSNGEFLELI
jgi:hypothetical protein